MKIPQSLYAKIKSNNLVVFVGAGLSINSGLPNWKELTIEILKGLKDYDDKSPKYIDAINDEIMSPIDVLEKVDNFKVHAIENLEKVIRAHDSKAPSSTHALIGQISTKIITTNYDNLLEKQYPDFEMITYNNKYKVSKISDYQKYIFKVHGDINEPDKCIFFPSQYESLYIVDEKAPIFELKKIISDKSILFIGFSLSDPYIEHVMSFINNIYEGFTQEHFIITTNKNHNYGKRIQPIIIESFDELDICLKEIIKQISNEPPKLEETQPISDYQNKDALESHGDIEIPPNNRFWVGRKKEIQNISLEIFKVIFITGIGGQGKSALAAYILKDSMQRDIYEFVDWRDFKEETNRFQTKLIALVQRLTAGAFNLKDYDKFSTNELIDIFFKYLNDRKILFVFDNIDSHIDLEYFTPSGSMKYFFEKAQNLPHNSKFIFTCRPFIREAGSYFYQIKLDGLSEEECQDIFELYKISVNKEQLHELAKKSYHLTKGHPLWLNLIAAQASRGIDTVTKFIKSIEDKTNFNEEAFSSILSEKILNEVWYSLNDKQRNLLQGIAESVQTETISNLKKIMESELNNNQFEKAFRVLKNLNLIEIKTSSSNEDLVELHPLVKEFITSKFPANERSKFITLLVQYYDKFIYILKPRLNENLSFADFQNWISKIELHINNGDYKTALVALEEVSLPILGAGYAEEFLRVSEKLYHSINWKIAIENEYPYFHSLFFKMTTTLTQFGKFTEVEDLLEKYSLDIPGKSNHYLSYCSEKCYCYWFQEKYKESIAIGEYGVYLLDESGVSDHSSLRHNLSLAYRDSGIVENIKNSLNYFLKGEDLENVLNTINEELGGHFYGNVGRCLELLGHKKNALTCYYISLCILNKSNNTYSILNMGYAASWIFKLLSSIKDKRNALYFYTLAVDRWEKTAPPKADKLKNDLKDMYINSQIRQEFEKIPKWKVINYCKEQAEIGSRVGYYPLD